MPESAPTTTSQAATQPPFVDRVWMATDPAAAPQSLMIFLSDGSLIMTSCVETYRLAQWTAEGDAIRWSEDTATIEARYRMQKEDELWLTIDGRDRQHVPAEIPFVCPDLPK